MAALVISPGVVGTAEPVRTACGGCLEPVLAVVVSAELVLAEPYEWEPRAECYVCRTIRARGQRRLNCDRCGGGGYVGERRPAGRMLAVDVAWSDDGHVRLVGPRTSRRKGEAFYPLHACAHAVALAA